MKRQRGRKGTNDTRATISIEGLREREREDTRTICFMDKHSRETRRTCLNAWNICGGICILNTPLSVSLSRAPAPAHPRSRSYLFSHSPALSIHKPLHLSVRLVRLAVCLCTFLCVYIGRSFTTTGVYVGLCVFPSYNSILCMCMDFVCSQPQVYRHISTSSPYDISMKILTNI